MAAYKDEERGTWYVSFYYEDWTGAKKRKVKRGFRTKKEALNFEAEYKRTAKADMDLSLIHIYLLITDSKGGNPIGWKRISIRENQKYWYYGAYRCW